MVDKSVVHLCRSRARGENESQGPVVGGENDGDDAGRESNDRDMCANPMGCHGKRHCVRISAFELNLQKGVILGKNL